MGGISRLSAEGLKPSICKLSASEGCHLSGVGEIKNVSFQFEATEMFFFFVYISLKDASWYYVASNDRMTVIWKRRGMKR
jgi:hypothetical protein